MYRLDRGLSGGDLLCGVDEAGRGPLAGPVVAAAVILDLRRPIPRLADSKLLRPRLREKLARRIQREAIGLGLALSSVEEIYDLGILEASRRAMVRAVEALSVRPGVVVVDGPHLPGLGRRQFNLIRADRRSASVAAASILAKVTRDRILRELDRRYPGYGFGRHKGYGTRAHLAALERLGPSPVHRLGFEPVRRFAA